MRFAVEEDFVSFFCGKIGCAIYAKDGCVPWRVDECLCGSTLDRVFHAVEW